MIRPRHVLLSSLLAACVVALFSAVPLSLHAQTVTTSSSYFMLQGPLGASGAYETYKFRVEYTGVLSIPGFSSEEQNSGLTLLAAVFGDGTVSASGTYTNAVGSAVAPNGFLSAFQMAGGSLVFPGDWPYGAQWNYFVEGGSYVNEFVTPVEIGGYVDDQWTWSKTGMSTRYLEDGSIDAWSYAPGVQVGEDEWGPIMFPPLPSGVGPTMADFSGPLYSETKISADDLPYTVYQIQSVPEPGRAFLLLVGAGVVVMARRRSRSGPV